MMKLNQYIADIEYAARFFNQHFIGKEMIYSTKNQSISLIFKKSNFMHLCGIHYQDKANEFFNAALSQRINTDKIKINPNGTTFLKLSLLKEVDKLLSPQIVLTQNAVYLHVKFDHVLRTKKQIFALGLETENGQFYYPKTLLKLSKKVNFPAGEQIISIQSRDLHSQEIKIYLPNQNQAA